MGTPEGVAGSGNVLPENFVPPPYPPTPGHFTSSWQRPSLSLSVPMALPHPRKGCKVLGMLGNYQRQRKGKGLGRDPAISFSFEKRETEALKAYVQDRLGLVLGPGIPLSDQKLPLTQ